MIYGAVMIERKALNASLTPELHSFVGELVRSGNYANHSEVVRAGLRLLKQDEAQRQRSVRPTGKPASESRA